jgi:hypothetical protein
MASNITQISGATEIRLYFRNYTYASALSDLAALETVNFTDLDRVGYKNTAGTLQKFMEDASGSSNIPEGHILFADANGRATSEAGFEYDGSAITLPAFEYGWSFHFTNTTMEIYKNGASIGVVLAEV